MWKFKVIFICFAIFKLSSSCKEGPQRYRFPQSDVYLALTKSGDRTSFGITRGSNIIQTVSLDDNYDDSKVERTDNGYILRGKDNYSVKMELTKNTGKYLEFRVTRSLTKGQLAQDCFDLNIGQVNWYGGPENRLQYWPVEKASFSSYSYVTKETDNCAITERYWVNSKGVFIYVEDETPLFIDQNSETSPNKLCFSARKALPYYTYDTDFTFNYRIGVAANAREAHMMAIKNFLHKPSAVADRRMVEKPIWSTWAKYKAEIDEAVVREFANQIKTNGFSNSQFEIDDDWEVCYGALTFRESKFPNIKGLVDDLKKDGFRVTLWIHPFINKNCETWYNEAKSKGYLVLDQTGNPDTQWWNSKKNEAAYVDFTNPEAAKWYYDRLKKLQDDTGIDSFKFDAGESSWTPPDPKLKGAFNKYPSLITSDYVRTVAQFGPIVEVRSGQGTQDLPIFMRMLDKDSEWNWDNGLPTLITTLLQLNMAGYPFVLPDMIGGNGYNNHPPNKEMFIRWLQANIFMPSLQFSYVPWDFDQETIDLSLALTALHEKYTNYIMKRFELATKTGEPVNPPLWWIDPNDVVARQIYDQFLLGDDIIAAPVIVPGQTERDIYLPQGSWIDGNTNEKHQGPKWIMKYPAPLKTLPYFLRDGIEF